VVVKRFSPAWRERFRTPRALRAFRRAYALRVRGVGCPEPLLAAATPAGTGVCVSALAGPPGADTLDLWRSVEGEGARPSRLERLAPAARRDAFERLGRFLRRLHDADVSHRDLKAANLVAWTTPKGLAFAVVDLEGARLRDRRVPWPRRARDLGRLDASLGAPVTRADRRRVLRGYYHAFARPGLPLAEFARLVARASARKRGPSGTPR
jgi:tRNA A-37 threonylcarbamoyl transferase component Bud32